MSEVNKRVLIDMLALTISLRLAGLTNNRELKDLKIKELDAKFNDILGPALKKFVDEICQ